MSRTPNKYDGKPHRWKPAWKLDPNRVLGAGPPADWGKIEETPKSKKRKKKDEG